MAAVLEGVTAAQSLACQLDLSTNFELPKPWIMVSINDDEDPHFRKAGRLSEHNSMEENNDLYYGSWDR